MEVSMRFHRTWLPSHWNPARILALAILTVTIPGCSDSSDSPVGPEPLSRKPWTWVVYDQSDYENAYDILADTEREDVHTLGFPKQVSSGDNLNVIVLVDREDEPAWILRIDESHGMDTVRSLGEVNMSAMETLRYIVSYAKEDYPAERYILSLYGHGGGWMGACGDLTGNNDVLTLGEMRDALSQAGGVDLALLNTPCLMGSFEAAYNLRDQADVYVASEYLSGWVNRPMRDLSEAIHANPTISTYDLSALLLDAIWEHRMIWEANGWDRLLTMSAIRTDRLAQIKFELDELSGHYLARVGQLRSHMDAVYDEITELRPSFMDLHDMAGELLTVESDQETRESLQAVQQALEDAVIAEIHGPEWDGMVHGLTLFLPDTASAWYLPLYVNPYYDLDFVQEARWDELMTALLDTYGASAASLSASHRLFPPGVGWSFQAPVPAGSESGRGLSRSCGWLNEPSGAARPPRAGG
jgi:hypothetical protein